MVPMMKRRGWLETDIEQVLVKTPARLLAYLSETAPPADAARA
jgi:hypothetical protein